LAVMAVQELLTRGHEIVNLDKKEWYTFIGVGGRCPLVAFMLGVCLDFKPSNDSDFIAMLGEQLGDTNLANQLSAALLKARFALASADAWRSFFIVAVAFVLVWLFMKKKTTVTVLIVGLGVLTLVDLWTVDKRYLNNDIFVDARISKTPFQEREVDQLIRMDKDPHYRVLDMTTNPFSDARASYFHHSFGGYHAAKLMRFQELLEHQFDGAMNEDVLDMFNVR